jgi:hypothetical protein
MDDVILSILMLDEPVPSKCRFLDDIQGISKIGIHGESARPSHLEFEIGASRRSCP